MNKVCRQKQIKIDSHESLYLPFKQDHQRGATQLSRFLETPRATGRIIIKALAQQERKPLSTQQEKENSEGPKKDWLVLMDTGNPLENPSSYRISFVPSSSP